MKRAEARWRPMAGWSPGTATAAYRDSVTVICEPPLWDFPHHRYRGTVVTVGAMAGVACAEWNVHAWDLARSLGTDYRPADPELGFEGWWAGTPQLRPPEAAGLLVAAPAQGDVWETMLQLFGRDPGWPA